MDLKYGDQNSPHIISLPPSFSFLPALTLQLVQIYKKTKTNVFLYLSAPF